MRQVGQHVSCRIKWRAQEILLLCFFITGLLAAGVPPVDAITSGEKILFRRVGAANTGHLWMVNPSGDPATLVQLTSGNVTDSEPAVSPDGKMVAFTRATPGNPNSFRIWVKVFASGIETVVSNDSPGFAQNDGNPSWAPDGQRIAFQRHNDSIAGTGRIWTVPLTISGGNVTPGTPARLSPASGLSRIWPAWNPITGSDLVFGMEVGGFNPLTVWRVTYPGGVESQVIPHQNGNYTPSYSPDALRITFLTFRHSEQGDIYIMNANGTGQTRVTCVSGFSVPKWSPDGTNLVTSRSSGSQSHIWKLPAPAIGGACSGGGLTQITSGNVEDSSPTWAVINAEPVPLDSDGDGMPDDEDVCLGTPTGHTVNSIGCELSFEEILNDFLIPGFGCVMVRMLGEPPIFCTEDFITDLITESLFGVKIRVTFTGRTEFRPYGGVVVMSPVDLIVRDPNGKVVSKTVIDRDESVYLQGDFLNHGTPQKFVFFTDPDPVLGNYSIEVKGDMAAGDGDVYSVLIYDRGALKTLVQNQPITAGETHVISYEFLPEPIIVNNLVTFAPLTSSVKTTLNTSGCPAGFVGKFSFNARLTDKSSSPPLSDLLAKVTTLSNGNLLQNADGGPAGVGATLTAPKAGNFSDGLLSPNEFVDVPFSICLKQMKAFSFFVDVLGVTQ